VQESTSFVVTPKKKTVETKKPVAPASKSSKLRGSATAAAILGHAPIKSNTAAASARPRPRVKIKPEWQEFYDNLLDLRERLLGQMSGLAKESTEEIANYSLHMADSGTDNFDRDFALSLLSADQDAVYEIDEALKRIERGTYGTCELTNKIIPRARLQAIPWARFTVEAQAQLEKEGALRQRKLGALGSVDTATSVEIDDDDGDAEEKPAKEKE